MGEDEETVRPGEGAETGPRPDLPEPEAMPYRVEGIVSRLIAGETILVPTRSSAQDLEDIFTLNQVATTVWGMIDGSRSVSDISDAVASEYDVPPDQSLDDTRELLAKFLAAAVIGIRPPDD